MCYFTCQAQKMAIYRGLTWFLILVKFKMATFWWRHRPPAAPPPIKYTSSCWEDQSLSTEGKIVSKYFNISKTQKRGSIPPPCTTVGVRLCLYVRGLIILFPYRAFRDYETSDLFGTLHNGVTNPNWWEANQLASVATQAWPMIWTRDYRKQNPDSGHGRDSGPPNSPVTN